MHLRILVDTAQFHEIAPVHIVKAFCLLADYSRDLLHLFIGHIHIVIACFLGCKCKFLSLCNAFVGQKHMLCIQHIA